jgi:hypothetical protein
MQECIQSKDQTVLEHGLSVWEYTKKLISGNWQGLNIPDWFSENHAYIVNNLHPTDIVKRYNIYHDCGKPYCLTEDEQGRHFPDHANVSKDIWNLNSGDKLVGDLIGWDMCLHTQTAEEILAHNWDIRTAFTLLVTALAEIHSNAQMFGGIDSTSFKIKWKKINQRGKMLLAQFPQGKHEYSYVIVPKDLNPVQQCIQGTHAASELFNNYDYHHGSIIYVVVKSEDKLKLVIEELLERGIHCTIFREPDLGNRITSVATEPLGDDDERRSYLKKFMLLK